MTKTAARSSEIGILTALGSRSTRPLHLHLLEDRGQMPSVKKADHRAATAPLR